MSETDTALQLQQLRMQLDRLELERQQKASAAQPVAAAPATPPPQEIPEELSAWIDVDGNIDAEAIIENLKSSTAKWLDGIDEDLKEARPSTILLVFGLGVMVGRLTA